MAVQREIKQLAGAMNMDDPIEVLGKGYHSYARNVLFRGTMPNMRMEPIPGTIPLINVYTLDGTDYLTIGRFYDSIGKRIFYFSYKASGISAIYIYNTLSGGFDRLVEEGSNAASNALGFNANTDIYNVNIIYGDSEQGDILYFLDSNGVPKKVNIQRALTGGYGLIRKEYLDVAKQPADIPPYVVYENDSASTVNNLRKKLFKFKIRWVFDDNDKAVTSSQGMLPLPYNPFDQSIDTDPTKNCRIAITYQTGPSNVKKIEILGAVSLGNTFSDFFLISSIDKAVDNLNDNDLATFLFYNNQAYDNIDVPESIQLFDYTPQTAKTQTLLNGNVLAYGNIKEGYPNLTNFSYSGNTSNIQTGSTPYYYGTTWSILAAAQNGDTAFETGNIHITVRGIILGQSPSIETYKVLFTNGTTIQYAVVSGDDSSAIIEGLRVDAISKGYTIVSNGGNDLVVSKANMSLAGTIIVSTYDYNTSISASFPAYDNFSKNGFGLVYFDDKGRTNGVVFTSGFSVTTSSYSEISSTVANKSKLTATIYHQPPDWAYYYQWVRTKDLSKLKIQQWISDRTFKDLSVVSGQSRYAYISIETLNDFVTANPGSPLGYGFTSGDRIRFIKLYNSDGSTSQIYSGKDFEVVASLINPTINGEVKSGQFIKIILPSTDGAFDFGTNFNNYYIEIYTPAQSVENNLNVYYEFGQRYTIGNPAAVNRYHQGMTQNQTSTYSQPAIFEFSGGDYYIRNRAVQVGNVYNYNVLGGNDTAGRILFGLTFVDSTYTDPNITAQSVPFSNISGNTPSGGFNPAADSRWFLKAITNTTFRMKGTLILSFTSAGDDSIPWRIFTKNLYGDILYLTDPFTPGSGGTFTFNIDVSFTLENDRIFLVAEGGERPISVLSSTFTITSSDRVIDQKMIDQNFSDYFASAVNSNGRSFVYNANSNQVTFPVLYRWSLAYQSDTNINQANRFYSTNFDSVDRSYGGIMAMKTWDRQLTFFQERKCGQTGVYQKFITDSGGNSQLLTTDTIIATNNVQYYDGNFGVGNQAQAIIQSGFVYYFVDPIRQRWLRLSRDGITDLGETYKCQTWVGQNTGRYLNPENYIFGGKQKLIGTFNFRKDNTSEVILVAQGMKIDGISYPGEAINFNEKLNDFQSIYDMDCDQIICAENTLYFWVAGQMYKQDISAPYGYLINIQRESSITLAFNENVAIKKNYFAVGYDSNKVFVSPSNGDIQTSWVNPQTSLRQISQLLQGDYENAEGIMVAGLLRDANSGPNSQIALLEGDYLQGVWLQITFKIQTGQFSYFLTPYITWTPNQRNF